VPSNAFSWARDSSGIDMVYSLYENRDSFFNCVDICGP
jgi:hypothetical protein